MKNPKCNLCNKEIINNEKENFELTMIRHMNPYNAQITYLYNLCYECNNNLVDLFAVYFGNKYRFRELFKVFVDVYTWIYLKFHQ